MASIKSRNTRRRKTGTFIILNGNRNPVPTQFAQNLEEYLTSISAALNLYVCIYVLHIYKTYTRILQILCPLPFKQLFYHLVFCSLHFAQDTLNPALPEKNSSSMKWENPCLFSNAFLPKGPTGPWHIFISCTADKAVLETEGAVFVLTHLFNCGTTKWSKSFEE